MQMFTFSTLNQGSSLARLIMQRRAIVSEALESKRRPHATERGFWIASSTAQIANRLTNQVKTQSRSDFTINL